MAPVVQIVTEEEYIELFGTESDDEAFYELESTDKTTEAQSVGDNSIEAAESDGTNKGEELQDRISLKNSKLYYLESRK